MIYVSIAVTAVLLIALRVLLTVGVKKECDCRETDSKALWTVLTAVIGFISAVTFACFVPKKEKRSKGSALILVSIIALIISTALFISFVTVPAYINMDNDSEPKFYSDDVTYKDENGDKIVYDKMGNTYTAEEYYNSFKWYDEKGNSYIQDNEEADDYGFGNHYFQCVETGEKYYDSGNDWDSDYSIYVNDKGYLCIFEYLTDELSIYDIGGDSMYCVYFDNKGSLYYYPDDVYFDENGNVVFNKYSLFNDFKYSDIPQEEFEIFDMEITQ